MNEGGCQELFLSFAKVLGIAFYLLWLKEDIPALLTGNIPLSVTSANLPTNPVHVLDVGLYLPAVIITALLLWRRKLLGSPCGSFAGI